MHLNSTITIRIIEPASPDCDFLLNNRISEFKKHGIHVLYDETEIDSSWDFTSGSVDIRLRALLQAIEEKNSNAILCSRGGYGASDLLELIPWERLNQTKPKLIAGFSDISAIQSAFYTKLKWPMLHGPMPATKYWQDLDQPDIKMLTQILAGKESSGSISFLEESVKNKTPIEGWIYGGCFSVLTALIGTAYIPADFTNAILLWEDIAEHPAKIMRYFNQWLQSGKLKGVAAIVLGSFSKNGNYEEDYQMIIYKEMTRRTDIPIFRSTDFGHTSPNFPFILGSHGKVTSTALRWHNKELKNP